MAISLDFLRELGRFSLVMKKRVNSAYSGSHASKQMGSGLVFRDFRKYYAGDDFRNIDWRLYSRTERLFIKRREEERNLSIHLLLDASGSMGYGKEITKFEYGAQMGLGFAYMALKNNERFTFSLFSDRLKPLKLYRGKNQLMSIVETLNNTKPKGNSNFEGSLNQYQDLVTSRSLIVIVSDFLLDPEEVFRTLSQYKRSELIMIQVLDPVEKRFALEGDFLLEDAESHETLKTMVTERMRQEYGERLREHVAALKEISDKLGAKYAIVSTADQVFSAFYAILASKGETAVL